MATATLIETDPLQSIQWPGAPAANQPTKPTSSKPLFGKELGVGVPIPVDLSFPIAPQTVWENKFIRFKFGLDGKYEVVRDNSPIIEHSTDIKVDPFKAKVSAAVGIKVQVTKSVEASIAYKFKSDFDEMVELLRTDKRGFRYALLRNLDVVLGKNIKLTDKDGKPFSECLKTIGVGLVFDPDLCICCGACAPECPELAIFDEDDVPESDRGSIAVAVEYGYRPLGKKIADLKLVAAPVTVKPSSSKPN